MLERLFDETAAKGDVFDVSALDSWGESVIERAGSECSFDLTRLQPGLRRSARRSSIRVSAKQLEPTTNCEVDIDRGLLDINTDMRPGGANAKSLTTVATFVIGEVGHFVDAYLLNDQQRTEIYRALRGSPKEPDDRVTIDDWFHPRSYWDQAGESFMAVFIYAYSNLSPDQRHFKFRATPATGRLLRRILGD